MSQLSRPDTKSLAFIRQCAIVSPDAVLLVFDDLLLKVLTSTMADVQDSQREGADHLKRCATCALGISMLSALCHAPQIADSPEMIARLSSIVKVSSHLISCFDYYDAQRHGIEADNVDFSMILW